MIAVSAASSASAIAAADGEAFDIPSLPLIEALDRWSAHTGISVGGGTVALDVKSTRVKGRMSAAKALDRMLRGTGWTSVARGPRIYRLVRVSSRTPSVPRRRVAVIPPEFDENAEIVVTANKRRLPSWSDGNGVEVTRFGTPLGFASSRSNVSGLADSIPSLTTTALGAGRNKLFVRGVADSSISGETQATLGEYFGETRTNYNAPDPGLMLYDVDQVELLKGPQGTLYGAATMGGILKIVPTRPDLNAFTQTVELATTLTKGGAPGSFAAATINAPLRLGAIGVRGVVYRQVDGGYIDDTLRGFRNINRTVTTGGRADVRFSLGETLVDVLGVRQVIDSRDSQYVDARQPGLSRQSAVAQPFRSGFSLLNVELRRPLGSRDLVSTTSLQRTHITADYDATAFVGAPTILDDDRRFSIISHETRLSRSDADGSGWLIGAVAFQQKQVRHRSLAGHDDPRIPAGFRDVLFDTAVFGQFAYRTGSLLLTAGARLSYSSLSAKAGDNEPLLGPSKIDPLREVRLSPAARLSWLVSDGVTASLGYHEGYRRPGLQQSRLTTQVIVDDVPQTVTGTAFTSFTGDVLRVVDTAFGYRSNGAHPFGFDVTLSAMQWSDIQADRIDDIGGVSPGFLRTWNSGDFLIGNIDASTTWHAATGLTFRSGLSLSKAKVSRWMVTVELHELPSIPDVVAYGNIDWTHAIAPGWQGAIEARASYRGKSRLGPGYLHDVVQGGATYSALGFSLAHAGYHLSATVQNVLDDRANAFAYGNPFTVALSGIGREQQATPQRPRNVSLGLRKEF